MGTCDKCGPMVPALVLTTGGLTFCGHCAHRYRESITIQEDARTAENALLSA